MENEVLREGKIKKKIKQNNMWFKNIFKDIRIGIKRNNSPKIRGNNNNITNNHYSYNPQEILESFKSELLKSNDQDCVQILEKILKR